MKRAFSKLFSLTSVHLEGNPVTQDEHFVEKMTEILPASTFGIDTYVNGSRLDKNPHKFVNTQATTKVDHSIRMDRNNIGLSLLDDDALLQAIIDKVENFRRRNWDMNEEDFTKGRDFLRLISEKVGEALVETEYSTNPDAEIFPCSTVKSSLSTSLIQSAYCRKEKRCFVEVNGMKETDMVMVITVPITSTQCTTNVLNKMVEVAKEVEVDTNTIDLHSMFYNKSIDLSEIMSASQEDPNSTSGDAVTDTETLEQEPHENKTPVSLENGGEM